MFKKKEREREMPPFVRLCAEKCSGATVTRIGQKELFQGASLHQPLLLARTQEPLCFPQTLSPGAKTWIEIGETVTNYEESCRGSNGWPGRERETE